MVLSICCVRRIVKVRVKVNVDNYVQTFFQAGD